MGVLKGLATAIAVAVVLLAAAMPASALPCSEQLENDLEYCYFRYDWLMGQFCYAEAYVGYPACLAQYNNAIAGL
ncbi:MAG: hypothetical protein NZ869_11185 [Thermoanaerobaculum sp.]|nr:hypothetical protein [Thermoanaerobaculum sp.]MDW7968291.1 hypothetical protein [Thermoanaerobaculum sp.]